MFYGLGVVDYKRSEKKEATLERNESIRRANHRRKEEKRAEKTTIWMAHTRVRYKRDGVDLMECLEVEGCGASCCRGFAIGTIGGAWTGDDVDVAEQCTRRHYSPRLPSLYMRPSSQLISALDLRALRVSTLTYSFLCIVLPSSEAE